MKQWIPDVNEALRRGERVVLCTILESKGSTPRGAGAKMAVLADGSIRGTIGGGAAEHQALVDALALMAQGRADVRRYVLHPGDAAELGMVCGGEQLVGFCCLLPEQLALTERLEALLQGAGSPWLETVYRPDGSAALRLIEREDLHAEGERLPTGPTLTQADGVCTMLEPLAEDGTVFLFGGGHVGAALVPTLAAVGFRVCVYDARPELAVPERFPAAAKVLCGPFDEISGVGTIGPDDYVVVMTPGHRADYAVLAQALRTPARYIGCIGSKKKVRCVADRLREAGYTDAALARVHSPIGLPILAQTPEEIAVSIAAEMILCRHGGLD